jgi:hypothetical protein
VGVATVNRFERGSGVVATEETISKLRRALDAAGVVFVEPNGLGPGVRLKGVETPSAR